MIALGIRCVKINAYLKQRKGFTNTGRLKKGIIGYEQWLRDQNEQESKFEGVNFLFDRRRLVDGEESDN